MNSRDDSLPIGLMARVWLPYACAYFFSYGLRNINAVLGPELAREFTLGAADLGLITGAYFVAFTLAQLPLGVLLDRYGPRRVNASLLLVAAAGCGLSALAPDIRAVVAGRAMIGLGVSLCLMSAYKAHAQWLPMSRVQFANSLLLTFGSLGVMSAAGPVGWALGFASWRTIMGFIGAMLVVASLFLLLVAPERREAAAGHSFAQLAAGFRGVFGSGKFWGPAIALGMIAGTFASLQGLWLGTWLRDVANQDQSGVVTTLTWIAFAATIGYTVVGVVFDRLLRRGVQPLTLFYAQGSLSIVIFALVAFAPAAIAIPIWILYCVLGAGGPIVFVILAQHFPSQLIGRVNTAANLVIFSIAFAFQWLIGVILDQWPVIDGRYAVAGYHAAFAGLLVMQIAGFAFFVFAARRWLRAPA